VAHANLADIYERHRRGLFAIALSVTRCPVRAEDAVHEAFLRLCRRIDRPAEDAVAYIFSAVRNAAIDQVRRLSLETNARREGSFLFELDPLEPEQRLADAERLSLVARAVETLPPEQREIVVLRIYGGLRFQQIANVIDLPLATVTTRYRRALERLKVRLESVV
jgi:RNA polymerase sigma-70 factor, ECF subfamily